MKTYEDNGYRYFYDTHIKMWTIYKIDENGYQVGNADYRGYKQRLKDAYPQLKFVPTNN